VANTPELQSMVCYVLYKSKCPFHVAPTAQSLLLAFGFYIHHIDLFGRYDSNFAVTPTALANLDELNERAGEYVNKHLPSAEAVSWESVLLAYKTLVSEIRETYAQIRYTAKLIMKVHDSDPSLDPEDIWVAFSEERIGKYAQIMGFNEKIEQRKEEEYKLRGTFWKWLEGAIDTVEDMSEVNTAVKCEKQFLEVCREVEEKYAYVTSVWQEISKLSSAVERKVSDVLDNYLESQVEIDKVFSELSPRFSLFESTLSSFLSSGECPLLLPVSFSLPKDRSDSDIALSKKADSLLQDLSKAQASTKLSVFRLMQSLEGIRVFNL
jgi:hypothetical protein